MNKSEVVEGVKLLSIPDGSFLMGHEYKHDPVLPENVNRYYPDEQPVHKVSLKSFFLGETQITQGQYKKLMGEDLSYFSGDDNLPVTNVSADKVEKFCNLLSKAQGLDLCYEESSERSRASDMTKNGYRMPTEAEWEYSCRAGTTTLFNTGNTEKDLDKAGWYLGNSDKKTHPVAQKEPNVWGLYDMHGNVFEFVNDNWNPNMCFGRYLTDVDTDPTYDYYFNLRITRGGDWFSEPCICRSALRSCFCNWAGIEQSFHTGFRIARNL